MLRSTTLGHKLDCEADNMLDTPALIREQEKLRIESLRRLEQLRIRRDNYRSGRFSECHLCSQFDVTSGAALGSASTSLREHSIHNGEKKTLLHGEEVRYRPVSTVVKSSFPRGLDVLNSSHCAPTPKSMQLSGDGQRHINACQSTSTVLSDDLRSERCSTSAIQAAKKQLITRKQMNLNNSSSADVHSEIRWLEPASVSSKSVDSNGDSKAPEFDTETGGYFLSTDVNSDNNNCCLTPQKSEQSLEGTPKSILRHRQIIDRNVHVESKFDHTPTTKSRGSKHRRGLNFSYSDVDDAQLFGRRTKSVNFDVNAENRTLKLNSQAVARVNPSSQANVSEDETRVKSISPPSSAAIMLPSSQRFYYAPAATDNCANLEDETTGLTTSQIASEGLLLQTGNDRQSAKIVRELESRSHTGLFAPDEPTASNVSTSAPSSQVVRKYICCHF